jgi:hypothetical protein
VQDALELRNYLHDRLLIRYADALEASGKTLAELLASSPSQLTNEYKMRRGHVARFFDRGSTCAVKVPDNLVLPARKITAAHHPQLVPKPEDPSQPLVPEDSSPKPKPNNNDTTNNNPFATTFATTNNNDLTTNPTVKMVTSFNSFNSDNDGKVNPLVLTCF